MHVVVPARDEEDRIGGCVRAIGRAVHAVRLARPGTTVTATLVLDRCTDGSLARAHEHVGDVAWDVVHVDAGRVGVARHRGILHATAGVPRPEEAWVATTDADSEVSPSWLVDHVDLARHHDLVVGAVRPDERDLSAATLEEWERRHGDVGAHVYGANLGVRLSTYLSVGGFPPVDQHEDALLVAAVRRAGAAWVHGSVVTTSARTSGRAPGGFSGYLRHLVDEVASRADA